MKHLLIIRLSAMGDVAMVPHALRALRESNPDLRISVLTRELFHPLFEGLNVEFVPLDLKGRHNGFSGLVRLASDIAALKVDFVADLHNVLRTKVVRTLLMLRGIPSSALRKGHVSKWMRLDGGCKAETKALQHTVLRYCSVLRKAGLKFDDPTAVERVARPNPMEFEKGSGKWIGVAPFTAHVGKRYPLPLMREVIKQLSERYEKVFVHSGPNEELDFAYEMEAQFENVVAVFSRLKIAQEIDLIANEDCVISMDSFVMHVASLVATPVVSVWGATHPMLGFSGYLGDPEGYVQIDMACRPCSTYGNKPCRFGDHRCLTQITPEEIVERVGLLIEKA